MKTELPITRIKIAIAKILYKFIRIVIRKNPLKVSRSGINYELDLTEGIDLSLYLFGGFQKHVYANIKIDTSSHFSIIDIGGNMGSMSLSFAKMFPNADIIAFEPTHFASARFKTNMGLNPELSNRIKLVQSFVSDSNDDSPSIKAYASWKVGGKDHEGDKHAVHLGTAMDTTGIPAKTLDWYTLNHNISSIRLIKIDTDGHEPKVLNGAKETIRTHQPVIVFEVGQYIMKEHKLNPSFYVDFFQSMNYELFNSSNLKKITKENWKEIVPALGTIDILAKPVS